MDQQTAISELATLIRDLCVHLMGNWQPEEHHKRIDELAAIANRARDVEQEVTNQ